MTLTRTRTLSLTLTLTLTLTPTLTLTLTLTLTTGGAAYTPPEPPRGTSERARREVSRFVYPYP